MDRKTKLIWSVSAEQCHPKLLKLFKPREWDAIRIAFRPKYSKKIAEFLDGIAELSKQQAYDHTIMLDLVNSTQARLSSDSETIVLVYDQDIIFAKKSGKNTLKIDCADSLDQVFLKETLVYLGFGEVVLKVCDVSADKVICKVIQGGSVKPDMEVHIPASKKVQTLAELEQIDLGPYIDRGCGYLIIPGSWSTQDIATYQQHLKVKYGTPPWLILRLDSMQTQTSLVNSLDLAKGIFISRKELALTASPAMVPILTKEFIQFCNLKAKMILTASDMLGSMRYKSSPTRAEVSDIANAVYDGTDAVVISEELIYGDYCEKAVSLMHDIIRDAEHAVNIESNWQMEKPKIVSEYDAIAFSAYQTARRIGAKAILCITQQGNTAFSLASYRPPIPIIAITFDKKVTRNLNLIRGVSAVFMEKDPSIDQVFASANVLLKKEYHLAPGDRIIFVSITLSSISKESSNLFTIHKVT